jgi:4-amino-4-deoxy-L-arabinose transferase-like glycosyltransferase
MPLPDSARVRWTLAVAAGVLALVLLNLWWVLTYRDGFPLNVDEAGYTAIALNDHLGLQSGGLHGWWSAVQTQTPNAPLLPALTSVLMIVKAGVMEGFVVLIGFFALLVFAAYGIGERLVGPRLGALAALVVGTSEGALLFSREYVFALPTAALLSCAVYALLRSERMRVTRWAVVCGAALGLMLLARTMAVAFVPGVFAAALVGILSTGDRGMKRRFLNLGLTAASMAVVASTWYFNNLTPVFDYLTSYGYGAQSAYYGAEHAIVSWGRFRSVTDRIVYDDLLVPLTALLLIALVALAIVAVRRVVASQNRGREVRRLASSDVFAVALVFVAGFAALMTSRNGGNGFSLPISMLLPPLGVVALRYWRAATVPFATLLVLVAVLNVAATSSLWESLAKPHFVSLPVFGEQPWLNGIPRTVDAVRVQVPGPATRFTDRDKGWPDADEKLAGMLLQQIYSGRLTSEVVAFASRNRAISSNSVGLSLLMTYNHPTPFTQLGAEPSDTVATYVRELTDPQFGLPGMLVTMNRNYGDFPPLVTQSRAEAAARRVGFRRVGEFTLPDGRQLRLWVEEVSSAADSHVRQSGSSRGSGRS